MMENNNTGNIINAGRRKGRGEKVGFNPILTSTMYLAEVNNSIEAVGISIEDPDQFEDAPTQAAELQKPADTIFRGGHTIGNPRGSGDGPDVVNGVVTHTESEIPVASAAVPTPTRSETAPDIDRTTPALPETVPNRGWNGRGRGRARGIIPSQSGCSPTIGSARSLLEPINSTNPISRLASNTINNGSTVSAMSTTPPNPTAGVGSTAATGSCADSHSPPPVGALPTNASNSGTHSTSSRTIRVPTTTPAVSSAKGYLSALGRGRSKNENSASVQLPPSTANVEPARLSTFRLDSTPINGRSSAFPSASDESPNFVAYPSSVVDTSSKSIPSGSSLGRGYSKIRACTTSGNPTSDERTSDSRSSPDFNSTLCSKPRSKTLSISTSAVDPARVTRPPSSLRSTSVTSSSPQRSTRSRHDERLEGSKFSVSDKFGESVAPGKCGRSECHLNIPARPSRGQPVGLSGRKIIVETNHLRLHMDRPNQTVFHYDVVIRPDKPYRLYRQIVEKFRMQEIPDEYPAFDGKKNLYFVRRLPNLEMTGTVPIWDQEAHKEKEFEVKIKLVSSVNMAALWKYMETGTSTEVPQEAIQALDIVLRSPAARNFVQVGRSFFTAPPGNCIQLSDGLDLWYGFFQSAILGWAPYLNIDVAHKGFPSPVNVIEAMRRILTSREKRGRGGTASAADISRSVSSIMEDGNLDPVTMSALRGFLKGLKVTYMLPSQPDTSRAYLINDLADSALRTKFKLATGQEVSVNDFFRKDKNYGIKYPNMPCLHVGPVKRSICLPAELCTISAGQAMTRKLNENQIRQMVTNAARPAYERKAKILDSMRLVDMDNDKCISHFGIKVSTEFEKVPARVLQAPILGYSSAVCPKDGTWRAEKFATSVTLTNWSIINIDDRTSREQVDFVASELQSLGPHHGLRVGRPDIIDVKEFKRGINSAKTVLAQLFRQQKADEKQIVLIIMASSGEHYAKIKQIAELEIGLLTQCIKGKTVHKCSRSTAANLLLKINAKLNGINHRIPRQSWPQYFSKVIMVVGADVTHPSPEQHNIPSFAAVVASHDLNAFQYNMLWRLQPPRVEIIEDLEEIIREQLKIFKFNTKRKPDGILFYRDGVSEGQFKTVLEKETSAIRRACVSLNADYKPTITFLVVQKRHHTRFFPRPEDADGSNRNVPAGTIVDTNITHPTELDFYLVSHASIQGTSRPTKYHLLWDDAGIPEDDLEQMTYYLCHMFTRCTRSVSYPAPTYYAHLAAFRIRNYFENNRITNEKLSSTMERMKISNILTKNNPMFFV